MNKIRKAAYVLNPSNVANSAKVWKFYRTYGYSVPFKKIVTL
jgi:hypothetical protein